MPYVFQFHDGNNDNIFDWTESERIDPKSIKVEDKSTEFISSAGTSIPSPLARMFLFRAAFRTVSSQLINSKKPFDNTSIYAGIVSETLDFLEVLYQSGGDKSRFSYEYWQFGNGSNNQSSNDTFFGEKLGHKLLSEAFGQAAASAPFDNKLEIILIYYNEGKKKILMGGTSPFTFVFTSPNFKRKFKEKSFIPIDGLVSGDKLFDSDYKQLADRDTSFIAYIEELCSRANGNESFVEFIKYVANCKRIDIRERFVDEIPLLDDILFGTNLPLSVKGINLNQISQEDYRCNIEEQSDFKIVLPVESPYKKYGEVNRVWTPLFLIDQMTHDGQYTSPTNKWVSGTRVSSTRYSENSLKEIYDRVLPGQSLKYPFFSSFDLFEPCLFKLPGYKLNDDRFTCIINNQTFLFPLTPLFFQLFSTESIGNYVSAKETEGEVTFTIKIPVFGKTKQNRTFVIQQTYSEQSQTNPIFVYSGIIGIFPFVKCITDKYGFINN